MNEAAEELDSSRETDEALKQSEENATLPTEDGTEAAEESAGTPPDEPSKPKRDPERRISQLTARAHRAEERAEYWRDQALRAQHKPVQSEQPEPEPKPPKLSDFKGDFEKFADAQNKYVKDIRDYDRRQAQKAEERKRAESEAREKQAKTGERERQYLAMFDQGREKHDDYDEVVFDETLELSQEVLDVTTDLENGADVLYALAQKPKELARISGLTGRQVVLEVAKFANSMKPAKGSNAPPPPRPARGAGDLADQGELRDDLPADEWIRRDRERRAKQGRR